MPTFSNNILTTAGKNLIAQATAANPIVYTGSLALEAYVPPATLVNFDLISGIQNKIDGTIVSSSAVGSVARVIAGFTNQASAKVIKTCIVYGRLENDTTDHCIIACSDETASIRIPSTSEASVQVQVSLNVSVNDDGTVTVTSGNAASVGDLDRMISCYKPGNPAEGVAQTIYGYKRFEDGLFAKELSVETTAYLLSISLLGSIYPVQNHAGSIGLDDRIFEIAYIDNIESTNIESTNIESTNIKSYQITQTIGNVTKLLPYNQPGSYGDAKIGDSGSEFSMGYINFIVTDKIEPKTANGTIGLDTKFDIISADKFYGTFMGDLQGRIPTPVKNSVGFNCPIGAIICAKINAAVNPGVSVVVDGSTITAKSCGLDGSVIDDLPNGTYTALSQTNGNNFVCFLIRTA